MRRTVSLNMPTLLLSLVGQILGAFLLWLFYIPISGRAHAAAPITPSGLNTQVNLAPAPPPGKTQYDITGGTRPGGGTNLFHSFGDFNVPNNNIANFLNNSGLATSNILGRVTGGNISNIFGTIQTTGFGNANLFMMNPAGFLFGPNATISVGGMVSFTSADYLRLADGVRFNAVPNAAADALLSAAPVAAFGFLGSNPGAITVQGSQFTVTEGTGISLVGGNITIQSGVLDDGVTIRPAGLTAHGGQINLASVASPGEILAGTMKQAPNINGQSFGALGAINISQQSVIDVSGNGGGTVSIRGGQFVLDNSTISANITGSGPITNGVESIGAGVDVQVSQTAVIKNAAVIDTSVTGNATPGVQYGGVDVKADRIEITGTLSFFGPPPSGPPAFTGIQSNVSPNSRTGNSGNITLDANSILINNFATITTTADGGGNAGNIVVRANQNIDMDFGMIRSGQSGAQPTPQGDAGNIDVTSAQGNISAKNASLFSSSTIESPGTAGKVTLSAPNGNIVLGDAAVVNTSITPPVNQDGVRAVREGGSGGILINANNLELDGGRIQIVNGSNLLAGDLTVNLSGSLSLHRGSILPISSTIQALAGQLQPQGLGSSAGLSLTAHDILITDGSTISTSTVGVGAAGPLNIAAVNLQLTKGGQISSASRQGLPPPLPPGSPPGPPIPPPTGNAGTVTIQGLGGPAQSVLIDGTGSGVLTNTVGTGTGRNINILANTLTLQNGGTLSAATSGTIPGAGHGGAILVQANTVNMTTGGTMTAASSGPGASGEVVVQGLASPAQSIVIDGSGSGIFSNTKGAGAGGDIQLSANSVTLHNGAQVSSSSTGPGIAGGITINAGNQFAMTNSTVTTEANQSSGGAIKIATNPDGTVRLTDNSLISASVLDGTGGGGSVNIDPQLVLLQNSQILAKAVSGPGGNINITTNLLIIDNTLIGPTTPAPSSAISASSQFGQNGAITVQSPIAPASRIIFLSQKPLIPTSLLTQRCAALAGGNFSSFTVAGRDSLPAEPSSWLSSPLASATSEFGGGPVSEASTHTSPSESVDEMPVLSLRRIAPPGFLTQGFAADWSAGCTS